jgi:hypothetical protein
MKIVQEKVGKEKFIELSLNEKECEFIKDYMIITQKCMIEDKEFNVGVKLELHENDNDE